MSATSEQSPIALSRSISDAGGADAPAPPAADELHEPARRAVHPAQLQGAVEVAESDTAVAVSDDDDAASMPGKHRGAAEAEPGSSATPPEPESNPDTEPGSKPDSAPGSAKDHPTDGRPDAAGSRPSGRHAADDSSASASHQHGTGSGGKHRRPEPAAA